MANIVREPCDEGVIRSAPPCPDRSGSVGRWVLLATILGSTVVFVDGTVTTLALPALQRDLHATVGDAQWVIEAYSLFLSALILVGGALGDQLGRRRLFMIGVGVFAIASAGSGLAVNVPMLLFWRGVQGVGGAMLTPGSLAIISATFSGAARGRAIGTWSGFSAVAGVIGPVLGGALIQYASWRWVFFINLPLAAVVLYVSWRHVPESVDQDDLGKPIDWRGAALGTMGLGLVVFGLIQSQTSGLSVLVLVSLLIGIVALVGFVFNERVAAMPMMPLTLFKSPVFAGTNVLTLLLYGALSGAFFFLPLNLIEVQRYPTAVAGAAMLPGILILSVLSRWTGGIVARTGPRLPLTIGPAVAGFGLLLFAFAGIGRSYWISFFPAAIVFGIGMAITVAPLTTAVMGAVPQSHAGVASGINNAVARTAGLLAIAVFGVIFVARFNADLDQRMAANAVPSQARSLIQAERSQLAAAKIPAEISPAVRSAVRSSLDKAFVDSFNVAMFVATGLAFAGALISWIVIPSPARGESVRIAPEQSRKSA
jgi:EmrB/QacA subfamily drug resistance transporter